MNNPALSIVAPCYNEDAVLPEFYRRVREVCRSSGVEGYEIVLVNDGSTDNTWRVIGELAERDPHIVAVNLARNHGHQLALTAGLSLCRGERVLVLDADLQDPPELLGEMMKRMDEGADVVYGQRSERQGESRFKRVSARLFYRLMDWIADTPIQRDTGDFRLMSRRVVDVFLRMPERHRFVRGMISWIGFRQMPLQYERAPRYAGDSKYPVLKMMRFATDAIVSFSTRPLSLAIWLGIGASIVSLLLIAYSLVSWLWLDTVPGWTSLLAAVSLLGGVQLVVLGVIGSYLGRLYQQNQQRPLFVIESVIREGRAVST